MSNFTKMLSLFWQPLICDERSIVFVICTYKSHYFSICASYDYFSVIKDSFSDGFLRYIEEIEKSKMADQDG